MTGKAPIIFQGFPGAAGILTPTPMPTMTQDDNTRRTIHDYRLC